MAAWLISIKFEKLAVDRTALGISASVLPLLADFVAKVG
jgi:hypothetical protein